MKITKKCIMALASVVMLVLQAFDIKFDLPLMNEIVSAAASLLVMIGIVGDSKSVEKGSDSTHSDANASNAPDAENERTGEQQKSKNSTENQTE